MNKETRQKLQELGNEADKLFQEKKWDAAIVKWDEMMALLPEDAAETKAAVLNNRGNAKSHMGDYKGAIADLDQALKIDPKDAEVYNNRGSAKGRMGDHKGALADYDRAIEINPKDVGAYNNRGNAKSHMGDHKGALADYDQAIEITPKDAEVYNNRGNAKSRMGDHKGAIADLDRAIEINPKDADVYSNRGSAKIKMDDYEGAIADCDHALKIVPKHENAIHNRAVARSLQLSQQGRKEIEEKYQAQLQAQQEQFDRERQEQLQKQQAQLRAQQKQFDREQEKQLQKQQEKIDEKLEKEYQAAVEIVESLEYSENMEKYGDNAWWRGFWVWAFSLVLAAAAIIVFGGIAAIAFGQWLACEKPCEIEGTSAFSLLPFMLMGTLLLSPLVWIIRMLNRDKHKYWALREDALANLSLARIIKSNLPLRQKLSERLFDHHSKRNNVDIIIDGNRADTDGGIFVSVQDIAKEIIKRFNLGGKGGDKGGNP